MNYEKLVLDLVTAWHESDRKQKLHEFMGLTAHEYAAFLQGYLSDQKVYNLYLKRKTQ